MTEYEIGDVVQGRFSARRHRVETAIVRYRIEGQFGGDVIEYEPGCGYGTWGYDREITHVLRKATADDEQAADLVKRKVTADTDALIASWRTPA